MISSANCSLPSIVSLIDIGAVNKPTIAVNLIFCINLIAIKRCNLKLRPKKKEISSALPLPVYELQVLKKANTFTPFLALLVLPFFPSLLVLYFLFFTCIGVQGYKITFPGIIAPLSSLQRSRTRHHSLESSLYFQSG